MAQKNIDGNVNISGILSASSISTPLITSAGASVEFGKPVDVDVLTSSESSISTKKPIVEVMTGYSFTPVSNRSYKYVGICKNGNKLTCVIYATLSFSSQLPALTAVDMGTFNIPSAVGSQLIPFTFADLPMLSGSKTAALTYIDTSLDIYQYIRKFGDTGLNVIFYSHTAIPADTPLLVRFEFTLLLSPNLAA